MPIYEYQCDHKDCGIKIEYLQKMTDEPMKVCPECNNSSLRRLVSAAGFRLKGGGWYETDFKDNNAKRKNLSSTTTSTNSDDKAVKTQDTNANTTSNNAAVKSDNHVATTITSGDKQATKE